LENISVIVPDLPFYSTLKGILLGHEVMFKQTKRVRFPAKGQ
jgi:hypothetical protein